MVSLLYFLAVAGAVLIPAIAFLPRERRRLIATILTIVAPLHLGVMFLANTRYEFIPSETDTIIYYNLSLRPAGSIWNALSEYTFAEGIYEGEYITKDWGGVYLKLLTITGEICGDGLLIRKSLGLPFLWLALVGVFRLAEIGFGLRIATRTAWAAALLPSLWYPFTVLYRDAITMGLHTWVLLCFVSLNCEYSRRFLSAIHLAVGVALLYALRPGTLAINIATMGPLCLLYMLLGRRGVRPMLGFLILAGCVGLIAVVSQLKEFAGIGTIDTAGAFRGELILAPFTMVVRWVGSLHLFLVSEPHIVSKKLDFLNNEQIRGILNGPWVVLGAPLAILGIGVLGRCLVVRIRSQSAVTIGAPRRQLMRPQIAKSSMVVEDVVAIAIIWYLLVWSMALSGLADFTRWRLPAVPILSLVAVVGWEKTSDSVRYTFLLGWMCLLLVWRSYFGA